MPSREISPVFSSMASEDANEGVVFVRVDVDKNPEAAKRAEITCMPTFVLYQDSAKVERFEGADRERLAAMVAKAAGIASEGRIEIRELEG